MKNNKMTHGTHHQHNEMHHQHMDEMSAMPAMAHEHMSYHEASNQSMDHSMMHMGNLKLKFIVSLILAIPIILLSPMMGVNLPFSFSFNGSEWFVLILATILYFYGGMPFLSGAKMELSMKNPAMMTLIALGISVSYFYSLYAFVQAATLSTFIVVSESVTHDVLFRHLREDPRVSG